MMTVPVILFLYFTILNEVPGEQSVGVTHSPQGPIFSCASVENLEPLGISVDPKSVPLNVDFTIEESCSIKSKEASLYDLYIF